MKERKITAGQIIMLVFLILILIANIAYISYDKLVFKKEEKVEKKETNERKEEIEEPKKRELSTAEQKILIDQIEVYNRDLSDYYPISKISDLDNQVKLLFAYKNLETKEEEFLQGELKKVIDTYFGINSKTRYEDIKCPADNQILYYYNNTTRVYNMEESHGHGGGGYYPNTAYYLKGEVTNDTNYVIDVHIIYGRRCGDTCGPLLKYYKTAKDAKNGENPVIIREEEKDLTEADYENVKDDLLVTTFTFEKDNKGNFGLISIKPKTE